MNNNVLYDTIFRRKSVRRFDMTPLSQEKLDQLQDFIRNIKRLDENIITEFSVQSEKEVSSLFAIKAPQYLSLYSEKKGSYLINAGFILQQVDLFLSASGLGSCWLGVAKPNKDAAQSREGLEYIIMLAFGNPAEPVHRTSIDQFKRNSLTEISSIKEAEELLEPVRLAPSAANSQPWFFSGDTQEIVVSRKKLNLVKAQIYGKMNVIDVGIALCHLWLSAEHQGKAVEFDLTEGGKAPGGYEYMTKVRLNDKL